MTNRNVVIGMEDNTTINVRLTAKGFNALTMTVTPPGDTPAFVHLTDLDGYNFLIPTAKVLFISATVAETETAVQDMTDVETR